VNLEGKRLLVTGVATRHSIAFAIAREAQLAGAEVVLTSFGRVRPLTERAVKQLPTPTDVLELDLSSDADLDALQSELKHRWGRVDGVVHAVAFAPEDALGPQFLETSGESAELAFRISAFSLKALTRALLPLFPEGGGAVVALDFDAQRAWPNYGWMGVAKAALEAVSRYLAAELGPRGVRVNLIAAGPIHTMATTGIPGVHHLEAAWHERAPLRWDTHDPSPIAHSVLFLLSDWARGITGEILHVDGGFHAVGLAPIAEDGGAESATDSDGESIAIAVEPMA
jgi:enoyl-[acyl-carrier protein] reductase I